MLSQEIIDRYKKAGEVVKECRKYSTPLIVEGKDILQAVNKIEEFIVKKGGKTAFPVNIAIDNIAAHFTPPFSSQLKFMRGDLVKVDIGAHVDGYIADTAVTVEVGTQNWRDIIKSANEALSVSMELIRDGVEVCVVGRSIEQCIKSFGFLPIQNLTGHSLERYNLHAGVSVPNVGDKKGGKFCEGMVLAIEPFATNGSGIVKEGKNSNIYKMVNKKFILSSGGRAMIDTIEREYVTLPFAQRWLHKYHTNIDSTLHLLVRHGIVKGYPMLMEVEGCKVAQAEHTVIVTSDGVIRIT